MTSGNCRHQKFLRQIICGLAIGAWLSSAALQSNAAQPSAPQAQSQLGAFNTAVDYVSTFYPLWFTYYQSQLGSHNQLAGPERVTPVYKLVVLINVDTLYASSFLDLTAEPIIVTVPSTPVIYSILTLDPYGNVFQSGIQAGSPGTYALTGPDFRGRLPAGVSRIKLPYNFMTLIFRADKASPEGKSQIAEADQFRRSLTTETLSDYKAGK